MNNECHRVATMEVTELPCFATKIYTHKRTVFDEYLYQTLYH